MTFLAPLFLLGAVALAVPILLHLLRRRDRKTRVFPALRYLKRTTREHERIVRLRHLLLLLTRLAAVVLLVLAGARLVLPIGGSDDPPAGVAIVVDNGLTSEAVVGEARILDSLLARALDVVDRTGPRDRIWIVPAGAPWMSSTPLSPDEARREIRALKPTEVSSDLPAALQRAGALLDAAAPELREIVLISDLRPEALEGIEPGVDVREDVVRVAPPPPPLEGDRGVADLMVAGGLVPRAGDLAEVAARIQGEDVGEGTVRAYLDDRLVGSVTPGTEGTALLQLPRLPVGWVRGRVEVEPDDLRGDDAAYFAFRSIPPPTVEILGAESPFLEEALGVLEDAGRLRTVESGPADVQMVGAGSDGTPSPESAVLVIPPDDPALLPSVNRTLGQLLPGWRMEADDTQDGSTILHVDSGGFADLLPALPAVRRAYRIQPDSRTAGSQLLTLSDGRPWIVEAESGGRRVVVLASGLGSESSDLPASAAMVPLVDLLVSRAVEPAAGTGFLAGEPIPLPPGSATVVLPDGTEGPTDGTGAFTETGTAGIYEVLGGDGTILAMAAVNAVPPGTTAALTPAEAVARIRGAWEEASVAEPWPGSILRERRGREVASSMLAALLLVLLAETWLAAETRRGSGSPSGPTSPET